MADHDCVQPGKPGILPKSVLPPVDPRLHQATRNRQCCPAAHKHVIIQGFPLALLDDPPEGRLARVIAGVGSTSRRDNRRTHRTQEFHSCTRS